MDKIISNGTEVLIFSENKNNDSKILEKKKSIKGVIISSKKSEDLSYHGSPWYEQIYIVLGDNGKTYEATYGSANSLIGNVYILTVDHYIKYINHLIEENNKKMIGKIEEVLVEGISEKKKDNYYGYTRNHKLINFTGDNIKAGDIVNVEVTDAKTWSLDGKLSK